MLVHLGNDIMCLATSKLKREQLHTNCRELPPYVKNHDDSHNEGHNVHATGSSLKDDGVRKLDVARIAVGFDADAG